MNFFRKYSQSGVKNGFTLIELLVVISIIIMFVAIILASVSTARQNTRDKRRVADLAEIEFALTLYKAKNGVYPETGHTEIGIGNSIDTDIEAFIGRVPSDPIVDAPNMGYGYWYSSSYTCTKAGETVLFARWTEQSKNANFQSVCTAASAANVALLKNTVHIVVLKN